VGGAIASVLVVGSSRLISGSTAAVSGVANTVVLVSAAGLLGKAAELATVSPLKTNLFFVLTTVADFEVYGVGSLISYKANEVACGCALFWSLNS